MANPAKILNRDLDVKGAVKVNGTTVVSSDNTVTLSGATSLSADMTIATTKKITTALSSSVVPVVITAVQEAVSGAKAISLGTYYTTVTTTGANALTLADATQPGLLKKIQMIVDAGDGTLTFNTNATIVFADVGDTAELIWTGTAWSPIALYNVADGVSAPAYTPAS